MENEYDFEELCCADVLGRVYITGDTHGGFGRVDRFCRKNHLDQSDTVVILGDARLNYYGGKKDRRLKECVNGLGPRFLCIHGNHEMRPETVRGYREEVWRGGTVYVEDAFPNLLFAKDGEVYDLNGLSAIAIGGAYSVDKHCRLARGWAWFADEQPDIETKARVEGKLEELGWKVDLVLTHTCPLEYEPTEVFLECVDQSTVDKSTEEWLGGIEKRLDYGRWYCGHFHTSKEVGRLRFMFEDWTELPQPEKEAVGEEEAY